MAVACASLPASATFAPLSPAFTTDLYCEVLTRLRPRILVVPQDLHHPARVAAKRCGVTELELVSDPSAPAGMFTFKMNGIGRMSPADKRPQRDIAYVVTSSGTTGRRKLIPLTHRRMVLSSQAQVSWFGYVPSDVGCHMLPLYLTYGLRVALMSPLLSGMAVACLPEANVTSFFDAVHELQPTCLWGGFTLLRDILLRAPAHEAAVARNRLRFICAGSGRLDPVEIDHLEQTFRTPVVVRLASSETDSVACQPLPPQPRKDHSVGIPLPGYNEVAIMGPAGRFCSPGETGEIVVRGPLVFDGYLDDPRATENAFVDGWFRTGDLGRLDDDGYLFLQGRIKEIINRGGEKISPVEIDSAIEALAGIRAAATFGIHHPTLGEEVAAAVIRHEHALIDESEIIEHVRERMGPKRVPRKVYFVDRLPRTESGKIRRSELPRLLGFDQMGATAPNPSAAHAAAPMSALEAALAGLWSSVLQVSNIGVNDDFFLLGGDSLRGARLLASVKAVFGVDLPTELLFRDAATVASMARAIGAARSARTRVDD
jgi:acyl-CoA synthetase (AMP-forming)/AMP-acid ligase II/acyl carrier protein